MRHSFAAPRRAIDSSPSTLAADLELDAQMKVGDQALLQEFLAAQQKRQPRCGSVKDEYQLPERRSQVTPTQVV